MKAIALTATERAGVIDVDSEVAAGDGEVVIRMRGLGLCGSDLSRFLGHRAVPQHPWVIGHEGFGTIIAVGDNVDPSRVGETVVVEPIIGCGHCRQCTRGSSSLCGERRVLGMTEAGIGAELVALPSSHVHVVPVDWSPSIMGCVEPLAVAVKAVEMARVADDADVLIVGGGAQGIFIAMILQGRGIRVTVAEISTEKASFVASLGIPLASEGGAHDWVFEASGSAGGWRRALGSVAPGGAIVLVGMGAAPIEFTSEDLVLRQVRILTSYVYDHPGGFHSAIEAITSGAVDPTRVVSAVIDAEDVQAGYRHALESAGKVVLSFENWGTA
ncbi:zinc-dependent alcohol dehydrogenase [Salinibacterium hongtaonis]|uniref:zinc-dependent alcohol dehydrogenase n=1 Tax=Homoserinimonas hongtaonis TaxID=2079791 RepID=UPI000D3CD3EE|nr:alcohol dehydrogenase catalytic domain-containing protein [Salinibacterium hongtaonis]AWB90153.1 hypothetical protein C2138_11905 [Salinibacterium hongtaonis]